jgi:hypothetical protein
MTLRDDTAYQKIENREAVRLKIRQIARRIGDAAVLKMERAFEDALLRGEVLRIGFSDEELTALVHNEALRLTDAN